MCTKHSIVYFLNQKSNDTLYFPINSLNDIKKYDNNFIIPGNSEIKFVKNIFVNNYFSSISLIKNFQTKLLQKKKNFFGKIKNFFLKNKIDDIFFQKLEKNLLMYDFGLETTNKIVNHLIWKYKNNFFKNESDVYCELKKFLLSILNIPSSKISNITTDYPYIIFVTGVNGVGKTTTIAKLAYLYKNMGKSVVLCASDTFRAAAIEQLKILGEQISVPVVTGVYGTDPSAVIFDAIQYVQSRNYDILLIDTAGRLHNQLHLMEELKKNLSVIKKQVLYAPHEILLVLDSCNGQNSFVQTKLFYKYLGEIHGLVLTKLDSTAKGGVIFSISDKLSIPIKYIGVGENLIDLYLFDPQKFILDIFP
ncbi:Signal recognition particle receptor FtsY [Buchnera aphidicola (Pterocallis alni)]|uniref:signal recognition particle-docking protein FtsY n=1 Tax=Buchnera aphidicola TaxID=9 RepID=UPI0034644144